jgi:hypothetical protein
MIRYSFLLLTCCTALAAWSQSAQQQIVIQGRFDLFTTDEMGNVYALQGDELELFDKRGKSWLRNSAKTFGRIHTIDAFYSLKPMVFSPEQGQLAVLDNTLSVQGSVMNLPRQGFPQVVLACMSVQNHFWLFDERDLQLIRVDSQLRPVASTGRLDQLLGITPAPTMMHEHESRLYLNDPEQGILVFDLFGTYMRTIPILGAGSIEVRSGRIYHFRDGALHVYDMRTFVTAEFPLPGGPYEGLRDARVERGQVFLLLPDSIVILDIPRDP